MNRQFQIWDKGKKIYRNTQVKQRKNDLTRCFLGRFVIYTIKIQENEGHSTNSDRKTKMS